MRRRLGRAPGQSSRAPSPTPSVPGRSPRRAAPAPPSSHGAADWRPGPPKPVAPRLSVAPAAVPGAPGRAPRHGGRVPPRAPGSRGLRPRRAPPGAQRWPASTRTGSGAATAPAGRQSPPGWRPIATPPPRAAATKALPPPPSEPAIAPLLSSLAPLAHPSPPTHRRDWRAYGRVPQRALGLASPRRSRSPHASSPQARASTPILSERQPGPCGRR
mmetsp:Transcript_55681/g.154116  ORF Transcript_55681/g.154116 Transcript_55681/m.154116 type:complete len:216 (-) Transcript_55681:1705-2352(-)